MIVKQGNRFLVKSQDGSKQLGAHSTREQAVKRLRQIEMFKRRKRPSGLLNPSPPSMPRG